MYVIFPADELILMTYGPAIPRIAPRPTLDCIRDPLVFSYGTTLSPNDIPPQTPTQKQTQKQSQTSNRQRTASTSKSNNASVPVPPHKPPPSPRTTKQQQQQQQQSVPPMHPSANDESSRTRPSSSSSNRFHLPRQSTAAVEPYGGGLSDPDTPLDDPYLQDDYGLSRERSPSIYLEPPSPDFSSNRPQTPTTSSSAKPKSPQTKSKLRPKLNISLGRLGRQQREINESARLREDLHLHVENPTFTRENLQKRNFDAFFESGEPVYRLHPKPASSTNLTVDSLSPSASFDGASGGGAYDMGGGTSGRLREPLSSRSKSADYDSSEKKTTGVPQKGDRFLGKIFRWAKRT